MVGIDFEMPSCCTNSSFEHCPFYNMCGHRETIRANFKPNDCPLVEAISKADYKADMVSMLNELQMEIEDLYPEHQCTGELTGFAEAIETITPIIQQKINLLKESKNESY